jgi:archaeal preflagellin peptidase FlaK
MEIIIVTIVLIGLIIGSYTDLKTREVPDWLNFSLVAIGIGANLIFSLVYLDYTFIVNSLAGFGLFFLFAILMYYTGQWGGGDSKMIMGLGALIGFDIFFRGFPVAISLLFNILIVGAAYGLIWSIVLVIKNFKKFKKEVSKVKNGIKNVLLIVMGLFLIASFFVKDIGLKTSLIILALAPILIYYLYVYVKAIENVCMLKYVTPDKLTEGDWIAKDIVVNGKKITGPKDLGISIVNIKKLVRFYKKGKIKKVLIKEGIPFVPSFLIGYLVTLIFGNIILLLV